MSYEIDMLEGALRARSKRTSELEAEMAGLRRELEAVKAEREHWRHLSDAPISRIKAAARTEALDAAFDALVPRMLTKADAQIVRDVLRSLKTPGRQEEAE